MLLKRKFRNHGIGAILDDFVVALVGFEVVRAGTDYVLELDYSMDEGVPSPIDYMTIVLRITRFLRVVGEMIARGLTALPTAITLSDPAFGIAVAVLSGFRRRNANGGKGHLGEIFLRAYKLYKADVTRRNYEVGRTVLLVVRVPVSRLARVEDAYRPEIFHD